MYDALPRFCFWVGRGPLDIELAQRGPDLIDPQPTGMWDDLDLNFVIMRARLRVSNYSAFVFGSCQFPYPRR